jgi:DNA-binding transcriptional ArsR family regulator
MRTRASARPAGPGGGRRARTEGVAVLSATFNMLGDGTRLRILLALARREMCVGEIAALVGLTDSAVSHQLRLMKAMRLVSRRRDGRSAYYALDDDHVAELMRVGMRHVSEERRMR